MMQHLKSFNVTCRHLPSRLFSYASPSFRYKPSAVVVTVRIATSLISQEQAEVNLNRCPTHPLLTFTLAAIAMCPAMSRIRLLALNGISSD